MHIVSNKKTIISYIVVWSAIGVIVICLHVVGLYFLFTEKNKKVSSLILIHISVVDILLISLEVPYHTWSLHRHKDATSHHKWKHVMNLVLLVSEFQSVILLTIDRVLAVTLGLTYQTKVTKERTCIAFVLIWVTSCAHIPYYFLTNKNTIYLVWEVIMLVIIVASYTYIALKIQSNSTNLNRTTPPIKYHVPLLIVCAFIAFTVFPDFLTRFVHKKPTWLYTIWFLSFICNPLIYIFGRPNIRSRIRKYYVKVTNSSSSSEASAPNDQHHVPNTKTQHDTLGIDNIIEQKTNTTNRAEPLIMVSDQMSTSGDRKQNTFASVEPLDSTENTEKINIASARVHLQDASAHKIDNIDQLYHVLLLKQKLVAV